MRSDLTCSRGAVDPIDTWLLVLLVIQQLRITALLAGKYGCPCNFVKYSKDLSRGIYLERVGSYPFRVIFSGSILSTGPDVRYHAGLARGYYSPHRPLSAPSFSQIVKISAAEHGQTS
jgi:hypothetical protein